MRAISYSAARQAAINEIKMISAETVGALAMVDSPPRPVGSGWIFTYNTLDYLRTVDALQSLAGNGPLYVYADGTVQRLTSGVPIEDAVP